MANREREDNIYYARLAEQGERYEDMIRYMKEVAKVSSQRENHACSLSIACETGLTAKAGRVRTRGCILSVNLKVDLKLSVDWAAEQRGAQPALGSVQEQRGKPSCCLENHFCHF